MNKSAISEYIRELLNDDGIAQEPHTGIDIIPSAFDQSINQDKNENTVKSANKIDTNTMLTQVEISLDKIPGYSKKHQADSQTKQIVVNVAGLKLGVPLDQAKCIIEMPVNLTGMENSDKIIGSTQWCDQSLIVINLGCVVIPAERTGLRNRLNKANKILVLYGGRWGLAVESVEQIAVFEKTGIQWYRPNKQHPFLHGIAVDDQCALLNIMALTRLVAGDGSASL